MVYHTTEHIYLDQQGNRVEGTDPTAHVLFAAPHDDIPDDVAEELGLTGGKGKRDPWPMGIEHTISTQKRVTSQDEAEMVQPRHANPVLIDEDGDGNFEDVNRADEARLGSGGIPEFRGADDARARLKRAPENVKAAAKKVADKELKASK